MICSILLRDSSDFLRRVFSAVIPVIIWLLGICILDSASISASDIEVQSLRLGFEGKGRVGNQIPLRIDLNGLPSDRDLVLKLTGADPLGNQCIDEIAAGRSDGTGKLSLSGDFILGRLDGILTISVHETSVNETGASEPIWSRSVPVRELTRSSLQRSTETSKAQPSSETPPEATESTASGSKPEAAAASGESVAAESVSLDLFRQSVLSVLTVGEAAGLSELEDRLNNSDSAELAFALLSIADVASFPTTRYGLASVDVVILSGAQQLSDDQFRALRDWIATGGHLILHSGESVSTLLGSPLGKWLQPQFEIDAEPVPIRDLSAIQNFVAGAVQLQTNRRTVNMARMRSSQIRVVVHSLEGPLLAHRSIGNGVVTVVALDLNERPLNGWKSLPQMYEILIHGKRLDQISSGPRRTSRISSSGVNDLGTQLIATIDAIPETERWSTWQIMAMIAVLALIVGPLDYAIVVLLLRRPALTWITFPVWIILACGYIYRESCASETAPITARSLQMMDVLSLPDGQYLHSRSWHSISSAETRRSSVTVTPFASPEISLSEPVDKVWFGWHGRAEDVYGGMYREGGAGLGREQYLRHLAPGKSSSSIESLPMLAAGSQGFISEALQAVSDPPIIESDFTVSGTGLLEGSLTNKLPCEIRDWVIVYGNRVYLPDPKSTDAERRIAAGAAWNRRLRFVRASDLRTFLIGARYQKLTGSGAALQSSQKSSIPYNEFGRDTFDIVLMMSLHETAGGGSYTGLNHHQNQDMEFSDSIRLNHALLMGTVDLPLTRILVDGEEISPVQTTTILRASMPVTQMAASESQMSEPAAVSSPEQPGSQPAESPQPSKESTESPSETSTPK